MAPGAPHSAVPSPSPDPLERVFGAFAAGVIRRKARQLVGMSGLTAGDREDIEQRLALKLLRHRCRYDPAQGPWTRFVTVVVEREAASLLRRQRAALRHYDRSEPGSERGDEISAPPQDARLGRRPRSPEDLAQLQADFRTVLAGLPEPLRRLAAQLADKPKAQVARELGVPRTTLYGDVRRLRECFTRAGLQHYLEDSPSPRAAPA